MDSERRRYNDRIAKLRRNEFPMLNGSTYLDHAGTTLYSRSLVDAFSAELMSNLIGNPHSASTSAARTSSRIEAIRLRVLRFFKADPEHFECVFVANATSAIKLVADAFRDHKDGFSYLYHRDCHTSLVGVREVAKNSRCFRSDGEVDAWLGAADPASNSQEPTLFAYPAQSNMNGQRLPLHWTGQARRSPQPNVYTLLDVAALVSTAPLDLSDHANSPDFISLSFYKIFGFPDLGALIVRKDAAHVLDQRRYFGGGTVEMVACLDEQWHRKKEKALHARLEDGTLPMRSIMALGCAMETHQKLFGSMVDVSKHTTWLAESLYNRMIDLRHGNGMPVCRVFKDPKSEYGDATTQGATVTFNFLDSRGEWFSNHQLNHLASSNDFHIRTGTLCNPGGMADALHISSSDLRTYYDAGFRCGGQDDVRGGKSVGMARTSLGPSSTMADVDRWIDFVKHNLVERSHVLPTASAETNPALSKTHYFAPRLLKMTHTAVYLWKRMHRESGRQCAPFEGTEKIRNVTVIEAEVPQSDSEHDLRFHKSMPNMGAAYLH